MNIAHINIGSNLGNRAEMIHRAVALISRYVGPVTAVSTPVESESWGYESANPFLNVGVNVETDLDPRSIVRLLQRIQREIAPGDAHRDALGRYCDRLIDLDLICLGNVISNDPEAIVPHPRMHQRPFVMTPLREILPEWQPPILNS